jgi:hypothetical protein
MRWPTYNRHVDRFDRYEGADRVPDPPAVKQALAANGVVPNSAHQVPHCEIEFCSVDFPAAAGIDRAGEFRVRKPPGIR